MVLLEHALCRNILDNSPRIFSNLRVSIWTNYDFMAQSGRWMFNDATLSACLKARSVFVDDVERTALRDVLDLTQKCTQQQFILLSPEPLDFPPSTDRIILAPLTVADVRQLAETWASALGVAWTSQQMSDFMKRYTGQDANQGGFCRLLMQ